MAGVELESAGGISQYQDGGQAVRRNGRFGQTKERPLIIRVGKKLRRGSTG